MRRNASPGSLEVESLLAGRKIHIPTAASVKVAPGGKGRIGILPVQGLGAEGGARDFPWDRFLFQWMRWVRGTRWS